MPDTTTISQGTSQPVLAMCIGSGLFDHALLLLKYGARADVADAAGRPLPYTLTEQSALPANAGMQDKILQVADALLKNGASATQAAPGLPPPSPPMGCGNHRRQAPRFPGVPGLAGKQVTPATGSRTLQGIRQHAGCAFRLPRSAAPSPGRHARTCGLSSP